MYDSSTASILLRGNSYSRGERAHKIAMEAMFRLQWRAFVQWLYQQYDSRVDETLMIEQVIACLQTLDEGKDVSTAMHTMCDVIIILLNCKNSACCPAECLQNQQYVMHRSLCMPGWRKFPQSKQHSSIH